jgi:hypothetical protein
MGNVQNFNNNITSSFLSVVALNEKFNAVGDYTRKFSL